MTPKPLIIGQARRVFWASLVAGLLLLGLFAFGNIRESLGFSAFSLLSALPPLGLYFLMGAVVVHLLYLIGLLITALRRPAHRPALLNTAGLLLLNLPVALACLFGASLLNALYGVSVVNESPGAISQLHLRVLNGRTSRNIAALEPGRQQFRWVLLRQDSYAVQATFQRAGTSQTDTVLLYVSPWAHGRHLTLPIPERKPVH